MTHATTSDKTLGSNGDLSPGPDSRRAPATRCNQRMNSTDQRDYGLAPQLRARLMGAFLAVVGVSLLVITALVFLLKLPGDVLTVLVILVVIAIFTLGSLLSRRWYVVRLDDIGYQVRFVRGAGRTKARWHEVEDLATTEVLGAKCVLIRLRDGSATTIPVNLIEGDREEFVDELKRRLSGPHGNSKR